MGSLPSSMYHVTASCKRPIHKKSVLFCSKKGSLHHSVPKENNLLITLWFFLVSIIAPLCNLPVGLESGKIPNARVTASSAYNARYTAPNGRLHKPFCWIAKYKNHNQWFKVDFARTTTIRKIATQGRRDANQWVTRYKLTYSLDTLHWATYRQRSQDKVCLNFPRFISP